MKRFIALIVVGLVSMVLSGCGQQAPKPTEMKVETTVAPSENQAAPEAAKTEEVKPAEEAPAHE